MLKGSGPIPRDVMEAVTGRIQDLADQGALPRASAGVAQATRGRAYGGDAAGVVRNPLAYAHTLRQEGETAASILAARPDLAPIVGQMRNPQANGKTKAGRAAVLEGYLASIRDPKQRASVEALLRPLMGFGQGGGLLR
jgi:hypothetical protein